MAADASCAQRRAEAPPAGVARCWEDGIALVGRGCICQIHTLPLNETNGAARIRDPILGGILTGCSASGRSYKNYG